MFGRTKLVLMRNQPRSDSIPREEKAFYYKGILFSITSLLMLIAAMCSALSTFDFIQRSETVNGLVVDTPCGGSHPVIHFTTR